MSSSFLTGENKIGGCLGFEVAKEKKIRENNSYLAQKWSSHFCEEIEINGKNSFRLLTVKKYQITSF